MTYKCVVCNYDGLYDEPYDERGIGSDEICPCCGFHYGYDDDGEDEKVYKEWRQKWINEGCKWFSKGRSKPESWNAKNQLSSLDS